MKNHLKNICDSDLILMLKQSVENEWNETVRIVALLSEAYRRGLYLQAGFSSLYVYARDYFHYSAGSAFRRSSAAMLVAKFPKTLEALANRELNLCSAAEAWVALQNQKKNQKPGKKEKPAVFTQKEQEEAVHSLFGKTKEEAVREIRSWNYSDDPEKEKGTLKPLTKNKTELRIVLTEEAYENFIKLQDLLSHQIQDRDPAELLNKLIELGLEKYDPARKEARTQKRKKSASVPESIEAIEKEAGEQTESSTVNRKSSINSDVNNNKNIKRAPVPDELKRQTFIKYNHQCAYTDPKTAKRCEAKRYLHIDHIFPVSRGGKNELDNLQVLCSQHNHWKSDRVLAKNNVAA